MKILGILGRENKSLTFQVDYKDGRLKYEGSQKRRAGKMEK
jgi:hypothetical protein